MAKKKNYPDLIFKGAVIILLIILISKFKGLQSNQNIYITNETIINMLENPTNNPGEFCSITASSYNVNVGDAVTFTLNDGVNNLCHVYGKYNSDPWSYIGPYTTGSNGKISETVTLGTAGTFYVAAICSSCVTEITDVWVNNPSDGGDGGSGGGTGEDFSSYTCGKSDWCPAGTCPTGYSCEGVDFLQYTTCVCVSGNEIHPAWKPGGEMHVVPGGCVTYTESVTHGGYSGASDYLSRSATNVLKVYQGLVNYVTPIDWTHVTSSPIINWDGPGAEPVPGASYSVQYEVC